MHALNKVDMAEMHSCKELNSLGMLEDTYFLVVCEESSVIVEGVGNSYETRADKKNDAHHREITPHASWNN